MTMCQICLTQPGTHCYGLPPMADNPFRVPPRITKQNSHFWTGGAEGKLNFLRCQDCQHWIHPAQPVCPECWGKNLKPEATSGLGEVYSFTLNTQQWVPAPDHPYAIVLIEFPEQKGLRLTSNMINCKAEDVKIGMKVKVAFEEHGSDPKKFYVPVFEPVEN